MSKTVTINQFISELEGIQKRASDLRPNARLFGAILQADVDRRFTTAPSTDSGGTVYGGVDWPRATEPYLRANPRRRGANLLRDTGELQQSFSIGQSANIYETDPSSLTFGSSLPKARGLHRKRPLVFAHDTLADELTTAYVSHIFP